MMDTMKRATCALLAIGAAWAADAHAASTLTRAQVRQELASLQAAGYRASLASSPDFPANMQAIIRRAAQMRGDGAGYGNDAGVRVDSGKPALPHAIDRGTYGHH
ncbi:purine nucleoside phosphorylase [Burkholderia dolosa]|nr:purine nucleoside phosphorylase [Burkholderia dolosa]